MFLVDTDVISVAAPTKAAPATVLLRWLNEHGSFIYVSAVTIAEIRRGIALVAAKGQSRKAKDLMVWQDNLTHAFADRILPVDTRVARRAGDLLGAAEARGASPGLPDALIAATSDVHGFLLVTGNDRHFGAMGIASHRPWADERARGP